jgi:ribonuclease P protein component
LQSDGKLPASADLPVGPGRNGLAKDSRLLGAADFDRVLKARKRVRQGPLVIAYAASELGHARLGLAISKRHARQSVLRNIVKRHIREVFRQHPVRACAVDCVAQLSHNIDRVVVARSVWQAHATAAFAAIVKGMRR